MLSPFQFRTRARGSPTQLRTIICLNCGGVLHLPDLLPLEGRDIKVVVFDSNRPIYHTSINSSQQVR